MSPGNCFRPVETGSSRERTVIGAAVAAACTILLLDQLTKVLVERNFMLHESRVVIENFFNLSYVRNYGAAWSILSGYGWFLLLIAALVLGAVGCGLFLSEAHNWTFREPVNLAVGLVSVAALMVIEVAWAASIFYALWRFYRSRFTEEGYLTWTLPVGGHSLLLSAILASVLEILLVGLATAASGALGLGVCALGIPWREAPADFWLQIRQGLTELWHRLPPYGGVIAEEGTPQQIFEDPQNERTKDFLSKVIHVI